MLSAEAHLAAPGRVAEDHAKMVEEAMILALRWPHLVGPAIVSICERVLRTPGLRPTAYDCALQGIAAAVYARPDLIGDRTASSLTTLLRREALPSSTYRLAGEVMTFLLSIRAAPSALRALVD